MAVHAPKYRQKPQKQPDLQVTVVPAPIKGIDGRLNLASGDQGNAIFGFLRRQQPHSNCR